MRTASYFTYRGPGRVAISRSLPKGYPEDFPRFAPLAPPAYHYSVAEYEAQLAALDPLQVQAQLLELAGGAEPVLLCFERPPFTESNWCHRRLVAAWFQRTIGLEVAELPAPKTVAEIRKELQGELFADIGE